MRLLVVEDEETPARTLQRGLEREGYAVDVSGDGAQALIRLGSITTTTTWPCSTSCFPGWA